MDIKDLYIVTHKARPDKYDLVQGLGGVYHHFNAGYDVYEVGSMRLVTRIGHVVDYEDDK